MFVMFRRQDTLKAYTNLSYISKHTDIGVPNTVQGTTLSQFFFLRYLTYRTHGTDVVQYDKA